MSRWALAGLALAWLACGDDSADAPTASLVQDVGDIQRTMADDLVVLALEEVESAVADDLPARAAHLLEVGAIPATERQREAVQGLEMGTDDGRAFRDEAAQLLAARKVALESYRAVLARGLVADDLAMLDAIHDQRVAEDAITELFARMEGIRPLPEAAEDDAPRRVRPPR